MRFMTWLVGLFGYRLVKLEATPQGSKKSPVEGLKPRPSLPPSGEPAWYAIAKKEMGEKEIRGAAHNPRIVEYHKTTTLKATDDETPWCSSFVNWCLKQVGIIGTNSAAARSWLQWGRRTSKPRVGSIAIFQRAGSDWQGHVGFYAGETETHILVLGGNQANQVNIAPYAKKDLLGFREPIESTK